MSLSPELREQVRQRARCACEYCGVSELVLEQQQLLQEQRDLVRILLERQD